MVAEFLDDNKPKNVFKTVSDFIDLGYFQLICQMVAKFSGVIPKGPYLSLEKAKEKMFCVHLVYEADA